MNFKKTVFLSGISTIVKLLSGLVINKIIAIYIGPSGIGLIGQFQNFLSIITTVGNGAINSGVTKYVAEYNELESKRRNDLISAAFLITIVCSVIVGLITIIGSTFFSQWILKTKEYSSIFKCLGLTLILISFNSVFLSIINGLKEIKTYILINIISSIMSLIIMVFLTIEYGIFGALFSLVIVQALILLITIPMAFKKITLNFTFSINKNFNKIHFQKLLAFSIMTIIAVISGSVTQILIRNHIINYFSIVEAGYWQSVWMISAMYLMIITTAFSTYYLPRLSELHLHSEIRKEILSGYKIILPFVFIAALSIYLLRDVIIVILFTPEFNSMRDLFAYQLIGDFFKMASWSLAFLMIAKAKVKLYIITEIVFSITLYILTMIFMKISGLVGVTHAYALNNLLYLITMCLIFKNIIFIKK